MILRLHMIPALMAALALPVSAENHGDLFKNLSDEVMGHIAPDGSSISNLNFTISDEKQDRFLKLAASVESAEKGQDDLARQATDPTASLMALNFQHIYTGAYHGPDPPGETDDQTTFQFRPVIPYQAFGKPNIFRATLPYQLGGRADEGWKPISLFNLTVFNEDWGRWAIGPVASIDTTGDLPDGFAIGPAFGFVYQVNKKLDLGLFSQNVFWSDTAVSNIQPVVAYQLGNGWSLSAGDLQFSYDWNDDRWLSLPVGFQIGKVTKLGDQPVRFSVNPQYNFANDSFLPEWSISFTFTSLFPTSK